MGNLNGQLNSLLVELMGNDSTAKIQRRTRQVYDEYQQAITWAYKDYGKVFLHHTNAVYITEHDGLNKLIVYVDDSMFAADLNAQREMIKGWINNTCNESIDVFEIHISRGNYRKQHPFDSLLENTETCELRQLNEDELDRVEEIGDSIENHKVREALKKAMTADLKRH